MTKRRDARRPNAAADATRVDAQKLAAIHTARRHRAMGTVGGLGIALAAGLTLSACQSAAVTLAGHVSLPPAAGSTGVGSAAAGVPVEVFSNTADIEVAQTVTDSRGNFSFDSSAVPDGSYRVLFSTNDWMGLATDWAGAETVTVSVGHPVYIGETLAPATAAVSGRVSDTTGAPISGASVDAVSTVSGDTEGTATSDNNGVYRFGGLPAGSYRFRFSASGWTTRYSNGAVSAATAPTVTFDGSASVGDVNTTLAQQATMSGLVYFGATPYAGESVLVLDAASSEVVATATTDSSGGFNVGGLNATGYDVLVVDPNHVTHYAWWGATNASPAPVVYTPTLASDLPLGTQYLVGADVSGGTTFVGQDLHGQNLAGADYSGADFTGANLSGVDFTGANLTGANFTNANLTNAVLTNATVDTAEFTGATLTGVTSGAVAGMPAAMPSTWGVINGYVAGPGANLSGADLSGHDFRASRSRAPTSATPTLPTPRSAAST